LALRGTIWYRNHSRSNDDRKQNTLHYSLHC
jgi:hypothetical protein